MAEPLSEEDLAVIAGRWDDPGVGGCEGACAEDVIDLIAEMRRLQKIINERTGPLVDDLVAAVRGRQDCERCERTIALDAEFLG